MYSCWPLHIDEQRQDVQLEPTYISSVPIQDVAQRICRKQWTIGRCSERESGISMLITWHEDEVLLNEINIGFPEQSWIEMTICGVEAPWLSVKKKVPREAVSKGLAVSLPGYERIHHHWFHWKRHTSKHWF